jgi:hypothetical protein
MQSLIRISPAKAMRGIAANEPRRQVAPRGAPGLSRGSDPDDKLVEEFGQDIEQLK